MDKDDAYKVVEKTIANLRLRKLHTCQATEHELWHLLDAAENDLRTALQALKPQEWQDIATAPKDGTSILLHYYGQAVEGRYSPSEIRGHMGSSRMQLWRTAAGVIHQHEPQPTHWMPLPTPPAAKEG
jgi:hypothetical protein